MDNTPSFRDDCTTGLLAFATGSAWGLSVASLTGFVAYTLIELDCRGEYMCGFDAGIWGVLIGLIVGALAFVGAAVWSMRKHAPIGRRLRTALLTFLGVPITLAMLFSLGGLV